MKMVERLLRNDRRLLWAVLAFVLLYYGLILSDLGLDGPPISLNFTFNSMLDHLLHGRFDVDPNAIGGEGFLRGGRVYAYWGIWCALLRFPLWAMGRLELDMTAWSCLAGACLGTMAKVKTLLFLRRHTGHGVGAAPVFALTLVYLILGGSGIAFLRASLFQEVVFWAAAFGAIFVYFAVVGLVSGEFSRGNLCGMSLCAGLALLTRVSTGIGLCVAFGFLVMVLLIRSKTSGQALPASRLLLPSAILLALLVCVGVVNFYRWGHVTTFADHTLYILNQRYPDRMPRTRLYGYFNLRRIPFGLQYFFLPLWVLPAGGGHLFLEAAQTRLLDAAELPPSSFLITDALAMIFIGFFAVAMRARSAAIMRLGKPELFAICAGLSLPCLLMLTAISMNYRYRMEFYPLLDLLAFLGIYAVLTSQSLLQQFQHRIRWMQAAAGLSVVSAFVAMVLYKLSAFGPSQELLRQGIVQYYLSQR